MAHQNEVGLAMPDSMKDFDTKYDLDTIRRARDIMKDSKRMKRVSSMITEEKKAFDDLQKGLRGREK